MEADTHTKTNTDMTRPGQAQAQGRKHDDAREVCLRSTRTGLRTQGRACPRIGNRPQGTQCCSKHVCPLALLTATPHLGSAGLTLLCHWIWLRTRSRSSRQGRGNGRRVCSASDWQARHTLHISSPCKTCSIQARPGLSKAAVRAAVLAAVLGLSSLLCVLRRGARS